MSNLVLAPSVLAANFLKLEEDLILVEKSEAEWLHIDIMDGSFVPNISFGPDIVKAMKKVSTKVFDLHLMIDNPDQLIPAFVDAGADQITVHIENCQHLHRTIQLIKSFGIKAGVALNPHSNINLLEDLLEDIDLVLIMSVNPGYGGQKFIEQSLNKIIKLKKRLIEKKLSTTIIVDGGVSLDNVQHLIEAGTNALVAGSSVFKSAQPAQTIKKFHEMFNSSLSV